MASPTVRIRFTASRLAMNVRWTLLIPCLALAAPASAQSPDDLAYFEKKVRPLFAEHCHSCHSQSAKKQKGGLRLDEQGAILRGGDSGPAVVAGKPDESLVIAAVEYRPGEKLQMPPKGKLPAREVAILKEWVRRGAPYPGATVATSKKTIDWDQARTFWSLQPLTGHDLPKVKAGDWPRRRIDHFILAEQEKRGLTPSPAADKRALLRRVKFDLVGLPPTPDEVDAFLADDSPEAYAAWIDRWLASPQYGERWGRAWLDLARYCDVAEPWSDVKGSSHLYRDWVVAAFNRDLPLDRFIHLQLAADLVPDATASDRAALGFLGLSPSYWKELQLPPELINEIVADEYEERIHTVTSTFLGLNVACARCHDHKFDPISTEDYYRLAGVFASCRPSDVAVQEGRTVEQIMKARGKIKSLEDELKKWQAKKTPDAAGMMLEISTQIDSFKKSNADWDAPLAPGVVEASLSVEPEAAGKHGTRLTYKPMPQDMAVQIRGNPNKPGAIVPRGFLTVLSAGSPAQFRQGSGRLELARALTTDAAPLTARVFVNRIWKLHFGAGLVDTPSDFGMQGERPSHPELLDDLAARFLASGWSVKWLHREILLSSTYRQSSGAAVPGDGDFRYLSRMPRRRLDVEAWRDAMLFVAGTLDPALGGPAVDLAHATNRRRTLYGIVKRRELSDLLRLHDFPDPITHSPARVPTTTPLQQLFVLNGSLLSQQANALSQRIQKEAGENDERVRQAYRLLFGRQPSPAELQLGIDFVRQGGDASWRQYAQVLLGSNEFLFVD